MGELLWMAGKAFLIAIVLTPIVRDIFRSYNMVDRPGKRKIHTYPIPRVGGIAIAIAYGVALLTAPVTVGAAAPSVWKVLPGAALVFLTGLLDDFFTLKPVIKIVGLVVAASLVFFSGLHIGDLAGQPVAVWLDFPLTVFWLLLIGFLLGCYGMIWTQKASTVLSMLVPLLALSIPLLDVSLSVLRRFLRNQPIFTADRRHIHHRLLDRGFSARQAVWVLYLFATLAAALALLASSHLGGKLQVVVIVLFCGAAGIGIHQLRYWEFDMAGQFLFRGGLKRALDGRLRLERLTLELERAGDERSWWGILVEGARSLGVSEIRWIGLDGERTETLAPSAAPAWTFRVSITDAEYIEVSGAVPDASSSFDLMGFAENVRRTFQARRAATQCEITVTAKS